MKPTEKGFLLIYYNCEIINLPFNMQIIVEAMAHSDSIM